MGTIPEFNHPKFQALAELMSQVANFSGSGGIVVRKGDGGWEFSIQPGLPSGREERRTVAVVGIPPAVPLDGQPADPSPGSESLAVQPFAVEVREVQYRSLPPLAPGTQDEVVEARLAERHIVPGYEFASEVFRAYPAIGFTVDDYEGFVVGQDDELDRTQTYLYVHLEGSEWILDQPPVVGSIEWAVVREVRADTDHFVLAQEVRRSDTDPWDGLMQPVGQAYNLNVYPHYIARDFKAMVTLQTTLTRETAILPVMRAGGTSWLWQDLRVDLIQARKRMRHTDCISAFAGGR